MSVHFFKKVGEIKIVPISFRILFIFGCLLLLSNFATNFINLQLSKKHIIDLNNEIMVSGLKELYSAAGNQYQIFTFTNDMDKSIQSIVSTARKSFNQPGSIALAFNNEGQFLFCVCADGTEIINGVLQRESSADNLEIEETELRIPFTEKFSDDEVLSMMNKNYGDGIQDGSLIFNSGIGEYFGVYKYQEDWDCYFVRAELRKDSMNTTLVLFGHISLIILALVMAFLFAGFAMFGSALSNVSRFASSLMEMQKMQKLSLIDLSSAPNDDVTYLAASFNALSSTINNLLGIFQKFVSKDVVEKAYTEHQIRLEGSSRELVMLFSDIKSFTFRTETLGNEIINLLNVHYNRVIHSVHEHSGIIGSIIGDAILAIYGISKKKNRAEDAVNAAWEITKATQELRSHLLVKRAEIEKERNLTEVEEKVFDAVFLDVGVGIDGGEVFYGNIGSDEHMTNTVIGDNVNSASRLEGLTRIYKVPVIVSEYIKNLIEAGPDVNKYRFFEIDTVMVKGKTTGKKIFLPLEKSVENFESLSKEYEEFEKGLEAYYKGDWDLARVLFKNCKLNVTEIFLERIGRKQADAGWSGIWVMQTK